MFKKARSFDPAFLMKFGLNLCFSAEKNEIQDFFAFSPEKPLTKEEKGDRMSKLL